MVAPLYTCSLSCIGSEIPIFSKACISKLPLDLGMAMLSRVCVQLPMRPSGDRGMSSFSIPPSKYNIAIIPGAAILDKEGGTMKLKDTVYLDDHRAAMAPLDCLYLQEIKIKFYLPKPSLFSVFRYMQPNQF